MQRFGFKLVEIRRVLQLWILPSDSGGASPYQRGSHECLSEALKLGEKKLLTMTDESTLPFKFGMNSMRRRRIRASLDALTAKAAPRSH